MSGKWKRPFAEISAEVAAAAALLADIRPDLIVFHCTGASMREGPAGDAAICNVIRDATGIGAISTGGAVVEALQALGVSTVVLISPYVQSNNDSEIAYLCKSGFSVVRDVGLGLKGGDEYANVPPEHWVRLAVDHARPEADGYFLACTNTTQIEAIPEIERRLGKPAVSSNQAVIWACLSRLRGVFGPPAASPCVGRLMQAIPTDRVQQARAAL